MRQLKTIALASVIFSAGIITAAALNTLRQAGAELREIRIQAREFEDDHARVVHEYVELRKQRMKVLHQISDEKSFDQQVGEALAIVGADNPESREEAKTFLRDLTNVSEFPPRDEQ